MIGFAAFLVFLVLGGGSMAFGQGGHMYNYNNGEIRNGYANQDQHDKLHTQFYSNLFNNKKNMSCCNNHDCRPTQERMKDGHYEVIINGVWHVVQPDEIIPKQAPDGGAHVCAGDPTQQDPLGRVYCVVIEPES